MDWNWKETVACIAIPVGCFALGALISFALRLIGV